VPGIRDWFAGGHECGESEGNEAGEDVGGADVDRIF